MFMDRLQPLPPADPAHRLCFAVVPPPAVVARMVEVWRLCGISAPLRRSGLRMTIQPVAEAEIVDAALTRFLCRPMQDFRFPGFDITLDRIANFGSRSARPRPLVFCAQGQDATPNALARAIRRRFAPTSWPLRAARVLPHVTAAHGRPLPESLRLVPPIHWRVDELLLIDSLQGAAAPVALARWPLGAL